jgi:hypothetical protein
LDSPLRDRAKLLDCGSPLPLSLLRAKIKSGRGLPQSKSFAQEGARDEKAPADWRSPGRCRKKRREMFEIRGLAILTIPSKYR